MDKNKYLKTTIIGIFISLQCVLFTVESAALCNQQTFLASEAQFKQAQHLKQRGQISAAEYKQLASEYIYQSSVCYDAMVPSSRQSVIKMDEGGVWMPGFGGNTSGVPMPEERIYRGLDSSEFVLDGRKWGNPVPGTPGGTVSYSYMANGVSMLGDPDFGGVNSHISSLTGYSPCFLAEVNTAFAAWSAVANIDFVEMVDNGVGFNVAGAVGDIRIGAHPFDGANGTIAHGFFPPPNGISASGDIHFDIAESWSCSPGANVFDIGIVALHEIGHAIGLGHELTNSAVMNPSYNDNLTGLLGDDIQGVQKVYGVPANGFGSLVYTPIQPCRLVDTRVFLPTKLPAGSTLSVSVAEAGSVSFLGQGGDCNLIVADNLAAAALNITSTQSEGNGYFTIFSTNPAPNASILNYLKGEDVANSAVVEVGEIGIPPPLYRISIFTSKTSHVVIDFMGYFSYPSN